MPSRDLKLGSDYLIRLDTIFICDMFINTLRPNEVDYNWDEIGNFPGPLPSGRIQALNKPRVLDSHTHKDTKPLTKKVNR